MVDLAVYLTQKPLSGGALPLKLDRPVAEVVSRAMHHLSAEW